MASVSPSLDERCINDSSPARAQYVWRNRSIVLMTRFNASTSRELCYTAVRIQACPGRGTGITMSDREEIEFMGGDVDGSNRRQIGSQYSAESPCGRKDAPLDAIVLRHRLLIKINLLLVCKRQATRTRGSRGHGSAHIQKRVFQRVGRVLIWHRASGMG